MPKWTTIDGRYTVEVATLSMVPEREEGDGILGLSVPRTDGTYLLITAPRGGDTKPARIAGGPPRDWLGRGPAPTVIAWCVNSAQVGRYLDLRTDLDDRSRRELLAEWKRQRGDGPRGPASTGSGQPDAGTTKGGAMPPRSNRRSRARSRAGATGQADNLGAGAKPEPDAKPDEPDETPQPPGADEGTDEAAAADATATGDAKADGEDELAQRRNKRAAAAKRHPAKDTPSEPVVEMAKKMVPQWRTKVTMPDGTVIEDQHTAYGHETEKAATACARKRIADATAAAS